MIKSLSPEEKNGRSARDIANSVMLPTLPGVACRLLQFAQQDDPDFNEMARIIRQDPAISGKLLTTVNSALFGFRSKTESIEKALPRLGASMVRTLILGFHLGSYQPNHALVAEILPRLWRSFLHQAVIAEMIGEMSGMDPARCFLAGMIQDIGILALVSEFPQTYRDQVLDKKRLPDVVAPEKACFGYSHIDVSIEITRNWNLGDEFFSAIRHHHDRMSVPSSETRSTSSRLGPVLQAANMGASFLLGDASEKRISPVRLMDWQRFLADHFDFDLQDTEQIIREVGDRVQENSVIFNVDTNDRIDGSRVVHAATRLLQDIAIKSQVELVSARTNRSPANDQADDRYRDYLSGLYNRRFLSEVLGKTIVGWSSKRASLAMVFIDVDNFKQINDQFGHAAGDDVIRHVAEWLGESTRAGDFVFRLGGDEFLIAAKIKDKFCHKLCDRIVNDIPEFRTEGGDLVPIGLSLGCVFYEPSRNDAVDPNWLIDQADQLMYDVKRNGGTNAKVLRLSGKSLEN